MNLHEAVRFLLWFGQRAMREPCISHYTQQELDSFLTAYQVVEGVAEHWLALYPEDYRYIEGQPFE